MKVVILSTMTRHHSYFIDRIGIDHDVVGVVLERKRLIKKYVTGPFYDAEQDLFEETSFQGSPDRPVSPAAGAWPEKYIEAYDVNQPGVAEYISALAPDLIITYGVGLVTPGVFSLPALGSINVHHGVLPDYRGLDSALWAIYENQFQKIGVSIHRVSATLDTGAVLDQRQVNIELGDEIYHLRYKCTVAAIEMTVPLLKSFSPGDTLPDQPQNAGRYFSSMPLEKKLVALDNFVKYQARMAHDN